MRFTRAQSLMMMALPLAALTCAADQAEGATITYTDRVAFEAAAQPNIFLDFDEPRDPTCVPGEPCHLTDDLIIWRSDFTAGSEVHYRDGAMQVGRHGVSTVFPEGTTAVGFDLSAPMRVGFAFSDGSPFTSFQVAGPFFGIVAPLFSMGLGPLNNPDTRVQVDNLAVSVPEPSTLLVLGSGLVLLNGRRRRVRRAKS